MIKLRNAIRLTQLFLSLSLCKMVFGLDGIQQVVIDSNAMANNAHMNEQQMNRPPPPAAHTNLLHMAGNFNF